MRAASRELYMSVLHSAAIQFGDYNLVLWWDPSNDNTGTHIPPQLTLKLSCIQNWT
jgi:hypothetical protein